ncbi:hypothetical protein [Pedobacter frigoris]|uniref:hypothetical protein n=1 Tax=Pedobacter frigoris TaxID=2571272 RepID=UPI00292DF32C|nr:hypothetical protein [Pedobacter frigoris]
MKIRYNKRNNAANKNRNRYWLIASIIVIIACSYFGIFHSHRYFGFDLNLWVVLAGGLALYVPYYIWLENNSKWDKLRTLLYYLFIGGPIIYPVIILHRYYVEKQLSDHGVTTSGIVTELYIKRGKSSRTPYAIFTYELNGKVWTQEVINKDYSLLSGDTLQLLCSEEDPEIFEVIK